MFSIENNQINNYTKSIFGVARIKFECAEHSAKYPPNYFYEYRLACYINKTINNNIGNWQEKLNTL